MNLPILLVDDNPDAGPLMARLLAAWGYESDVVQDGAHALELMDRKRYGLAIVDYLMPGMNGVELFQRMHARDPKLTGILLTGYTTIDVVYPAIEAGVLRVLPKPADFQELLPILQEHLGSAA
jgi:DNA-binding NtrC family response regulator